MTHQILDYFEKLHQEDPSFAYRVHRDGTGDPIGFAWQMSVMQAVYEDGECLFADAMK